MLVQIYESHRLGCCFDLDDTLISEYDYQRSGISAVEASIASLYGVSFEGRIQAALNNGVKDIWGWACEQPSPQLSLKQVFLAVQAA